MFDYQLEKRDAQLREGMSLAGKLGLKVGHPADYWKAFHSGAGSEH